MPTTFADSVFSEYELRELAIKMNDDSDGDFVHADCVGSWENEAEVITVTKNCRGKVAKKRTTGTGSGTVTYSGHIPNSLIIKMFNMDADGLVSGVAAYGRESRHREFTAVGKVLDEDGNVKYIAYPKMIANTFSGTIENGAEEVAEREIELSYMPDDNGFGYYEAREADLGTDTASLKTKWMTEWTSELMKAPTA